MEGLVRSVGQSARRLRREWRFAAAVTGILALGIGPAAAMLSVTEKILVRPLPYADADRVGLLRISVGSLQAHPGLSQLEAIRLREAGIFQSVEVQTRVQDASYGPPDNLQTYKQMMVTTGMFSMLGIRPALGRYLEERDIPAPVRFPPPPPVRPGESPPPPPPPPPPPLSAVMLDHGVWERQFGQDPSVLGRILSINGAPYEVVGVLPRGVQLVTGRAIPQPIDFYHPLRLYEFTAWMHPTLVRLRPGDTFEQAQAALDAFAERTQRERPQAYSGGRLRLTLAPALDDITRATRPALRAATGAVGLLLVIAFANATALVVARLRTRDADLAIRAAMGASRRALVTDVVAEALVLGLLATVAGIVVCLGAVSAIRELIPRTVPRWEEIGVGWDLVGYTTALTFLGLLASGIAPLWRVARGGMWSAIRSGSAQGGQAETSRSRLILVTAQIALTVVLGFACVQLMRSAARLSDIDLGYDPDVLALGVPYDFLANFGNERRADLYQRIRNQVQAVPGVVNAGVASHVPLGGTAMSGGYQVDPTKDIGFDPYANYFPVGPGYLTTMKATFLEGRDFTDTEDLQRERVIIVDDTLARSAFPGRTNVVGESLKLSWGLQTGRIVGVIRHIRAVDMTREVRPQIYAPLGNLFQNQGFVTVRSSVPPRTLVPAITGAINDARPGRAISSVVMLSEHVSAATSTLTAVTALIGFLAVSAGALSAVGLYLVLSYIVFQQKRATAIRLALGASTRQVMWQHGRRSVVVFMAAVPVGVIIALAVAPYFGDLLYGVGIRDVSSLAWAVGVAALVAAIGTWVPVLRSTGANIVTVLRSE